LIKEYDASHDAKEKLTLKTMIMPLSKDDLLIESCGISYGKTK